MITLEEYFNKTKKEDIYNFYTKLISSSKSFSSITRNEMYQAITSKYQNDPEIILDLCNAEKLNILKTLLNNPLNKNRDYGYIEYLLFTNLKKNFLILDNDNNEYYIPSDLINYIKMAFNLLDEKSYSFKDVTDSVMIGLVRIYNVLTIEEYIDYLKNYHIEIKEKELKDYINNQIRFQSIIKIIRYKKTDYVVSLEKNYYKDVLNLNKDYIKPKIYSLEEVISIGKYKINLFKEEIFKYLSFLEMHLEGMYIDNIIDDLLLYAGFDIEDEKVLDKITDSIPALLEETKKVISYFPIWVYKGNDLISLKSNIILPKKNEPCFCGSGKKFKHCCMKFYKK